MEHTLYVDETGTFRATDAGPQPGMRGVGGLLLAGNSQEHERLLRPLLRDALEWAPALHHAHEMTAFGACKALRGTADADVPLHLRTAKLWLRDGGGPATLRGCEHFQRLEQEARRLRSAVAQLVGHACGALSGCGVVALEHNLRPPASRYPAMLVALLRLALDQAAQACSAPGALHVLAESGADGQHEVEAALLEGLDAQQRAALAPVRFVEKGSLAALILSDHLLHRIAPAFRQTAPRSGPDVTRLSLGALEGRLGRECGLRAEHLVLTDALEVGPRRRALREGREQGSTLRWELKGLRSALPAGVLKASIESGLRHWPREEA